MLIRRTATGEEVAVASAIRANKAENIGGNKKQQLNLNGPKTAPSGIGAVSVQAPKLENNHSVPTNELRSLSSDAIFESDASLSVLSLILIDAPTRHDIGALLQCRATNIDAQKPIIRVMKFDVNCEYFY